MRNVWFVLFNGGIVWTMTFVMGCTGPTLRALSPDEAKVDVYPSGEVRVYGKPIKMGELSSLIRRSSTRPQDPIFVRLHGLADAPEMVELRQYVTDQMMRAEHYKFSFFSTPHATVTTLDPVTGKASTLVSEQPLEVLTGDASLRDIERLKAEQEAYEEGHYVSPAVGRRPVAVGTPPEALCVQARVGAESRQTSVVRTNPAAESREASAEVSDEDELREAWRRQQRTAAKPSRSGR